MSLAKFLIAATVFGTLITETSSASGIVNIEGNISPSCAIGATNFPHNLFPINVLSKVGTITVSCNAYEFTVTFSSANAGKLVGPGGQFANYQFRSPGFNAIGQGRNCGMLDGTNVKLSLIQLPALPGLVATADNSANAFLTAKTSDVCAMATSNPALRYGGSYTDTVLATITPLP